MVVAFILSPSRSRRCALAIINLGGCNAFSISSTLGCDFAFFFLIGRRRARAFAACVFSPEMCTAPLWGAPHRAHHSAVLLTAAHLANAGATAPHERKRLFFLADPVQRSAGESGEGSCPPPLLRAIEPGGPCALCSHQAPFGSLHKRSGPAGGKACFPIFEYLRG